MIISSKSDWFGKNDNTSVLSEWEVLSKTKNCLKISRQLPKKKKLPKDLEKQCGVANLMHRGRI